MAKRRKFNLEEIEDSFLNLTPLIDVVLVVLVSFVLIAPLIEIDRVSLAVGATKEFEPSSMQKSLINIYVLENNSIKLNAKEISLSELKGELAWMKQKYPREIPQLFQDKKSCFGTYQEVKNLVEETGFTNLDVILKMD